MRSRRKILIVSAISGSGHGVTARALESLLAETHDVEVVPVHRILGTFNYIGELFYNICLLHGWIGLIEPYHRLAKRLMRLYRPFLLAAIRRHNRRCHFDCIVSCIPWVNHFFLRALPDIPLVTVITDFCHSSTHPWIQHKKQYMICPSEKAAGQARALGLHDSHIFPVSGNIIAPGFYTEPATIQKSPPSLESLGLDPAKKTALVFYGGFGPDFMGDLVNVIDGWNVIVIWGNNQNRVQKPGCANLGFTRDIPYYMRISDLLVGKPGPGVIAEAVHCDLPVLADARKKTLLPQEADVLEWIQKSGLGTSFCSLADFRRKISSITDADLARWKSNTEKKTNSSLFETADIIKTIVDGPDERE